MIDETKIPQHIWEQIAKSTLEFCKRQKEKKNQDEPANDTNKD